MPEEIIWTATPLKDAINKVTRDGQFEWKFRGFTTSNKQHWNGQPIKTGVRIEVFHPKRKLWENFTIRDDYDFDRGERPSGKGYHVNVELPDEKIAYCSTGSGGKAYVEQCWGFISERASVDGDEKAAHWYMNGKSG